MSRIIWGDKAGTTLVEALVAIVILGVAIVPVTALITKSINEIDQGNRTTQLNLCVQAYMELNMALDFSSLGDGTTYCDLACDCASVYSDARPIRCDVDVTTNPGGGWDSYMREVSVSMEHVTMRTLRVRLVH